MTIVLAVAFTFFSLIIFIVYPSMIYIIPCMILIDILLAILYRHYSFDNLKYRFGQMQYAAIREIILFIDSGMPDYTNSIALEYNMRIQKISKLAHILTNNDSTFIVNMYKLKPDTIPIVINIRKEDLNKMIEKEDCIYNEKAANSEIMNLTRVIKKIMEKGE